MDDFGRQMESEEYRYRGPVIVIVGPTASGKTGVSIEIAKEVNGEIISADSRAIYKGMDIGTAKPSAAEQQGIAHFGFDLVEPGERFTVADFKTFAEQKICSISKHGKVPIVCGGTGLYVDALIYNYQFSKGSKNNNVKIIEQGFAEKYPDRVEMDEKYVVFGIDWPKEILRERIRGRLNKIFVQELFEETRRLVETYGWGSQAMKSDIYEYAWGYLEGKYDLETAKRLCFYRDWHLAKRQMTWFRRNSNINWLPLDEIKPAAIKIVEKYV